MKTFYTLIVVALAGFATLPPAMAGQGGPDQFGYTWIDNQQPGGPVYQWIDIVSPDRRITGLSDDNIRGPFYITTTGNDYFTYYWYPVDKLWIGSNGYISFSPSNLASVFPTIPDSLDNKHNFIAAMMSDLTFSGAGNPAMCYMKASPDSVIISYLNVPFYSNNPPYWAGSNTFQIILDKTDRSITVNYQSQSGTAYTATDVRGGIENLTGSIGLQAYAGTYPTAGKTIKYYYPPVSNYFITDGAIRYNSVPYNRGCFLPYPTVFPLQSSVANTGNLPIPPGFTTTCTVRNQSGAVSLTDTFIYNDTLNVQQDSLLHFNSQFIPALPGTYIFATQLSGIPNDAVANNDTASRELVVIDTSLSTYMLQFCDNVPDLAGISWVDGTGGVGMYFEPPTYPVSINQVHFYLTSNINNVGCFIKIYDDDGPNGTPGTMLDSVPVPAPVPSGAWTTVNYNNPVVINSGGFYVGWLMDGLNITMGVDRTPPISHRSFEIVGGAWAEYRDALSQDFMIRCQVQKTQFKDLGINEILNPVAGDTMTTTTQVQCRIKNYGQAPVTNFQVYYKLFGQTTVSAYYNGTALNPGDSMTYTFTVPILPAFNFNGPLCVWTDVPYDMDNSNDTTCINVTTALIAGLDETGDHSLIRLSPNPFSDYTILEVRNDGSSWDLDLLDLTGRRVLEERALQQRKYRIEKQGLQPGMYILRVKGKSWQGTEKLIVR